MVLAVVFSNRVGQVGRPTVGPVRTQPHPFLAAKRRRFKTQVRIARGADAAQRRARSSLTLGTRPLFDRRRGRGRSQQVALTRMYEPSKRTACVSVSSILCLRSFLLRLRDPDGHLAAGTMCLPPSVPDVCLEHMTISANKANRHRTVPPGVVGPAGQPMCRYGTLGSSVSKLNPRRG